MRWAGTGVLLFAMLLDRADAASTGATCDDPLAFGANGYVGTFFSADFLFQTDGLAYSRGAQCTDASLPRGKTTWLRLDGLTLRLVYRSAGACSKL